MSDSPSPSSESLFSSSPQSPVKAPTSLLSRNHVPSEFHHRDQQTKTLVDAFVGAVKRGSAFNFAVYGPSGTGKTSGCLWSYRHVCDALAAESPGTPLLHRTLHRAWVTMTTGEVSTVYQALTALTLDLAKDAGREEKLDKFLLRNEPYTAFRKLCEEVGGVIVLLLDDIDKLKARVPKEEFDGFICFLAELNDRINVPTSDARSPSDHVAILILATCVAAPTFYDLSPSTEQRFFPRKLDFPPYTQSQLHDILRARCVEVFIDGVVDDEALASLAGEVAADSGSARVVVDVLRIAAEKVMEHAGVRLDAKLASWALEEAARRELAESIGPIPRNQKMLLKLIYTRAATMPRRPIIFNQVVEDYVHLPSPYGHASRKQVRRYLDALELDQFVSCTYLPRHNTRGGPLLAVVTEAPPDVVLEAISRDPHFLPPTRASAGKAQHTFSLEGASV